MRSQASDSSFVVVMRSIASMTCRPRTRGIMMNSQGDGIGPTGISISVGPSRRLKPRRKAARSSCGRFDALGGGAEALGEFHEIGIGEVARDQCGCHTIPAGSPHVAEGAVVEHDADQRNR